MPDEPAALSLDAKAAAFAKQHGSFSLSFDAAQNYVRPDDCPWTLELEPPVVRADGCTGWMGFTAAEALDFAASELTGIPVSGLPVREAANGS